MTNRPQHPGVRRAARALALTPAIVVLGGAGAAVADVPESWPSTDHVSATYVLLVLGAIPLGLFLLVTLLVYLPSMRHNEEQAEGHGWRGQPEWFGGPRAGLEAVDRTPPPAVGAGASGSSDPGTVRGGTSGRW